MTAIEQARIERGVTAKTIAVIMGISLTRYRCIERRPHRATIDEAETLAVILGKPIRHLFSELAESDSINRDVKDHALEEKRKCDRVSKTENEKGQE